MKKASTAVEKVVSSGVLSTTSGFVWRQRGTQPHEVEVRVVTSYVICYLTYGYTINPLIKQPVGDMSYEPLIMGRQWYITAATAGAVLAR